MAYEPEAVAAHELETWQRLQVYMSTTLPH